MNNAADNTHRQAALCAAFRPRRRRRLLHNADYVHPEPLSRGRGKPRKLGLADILPLQKLDFRRECRNGAAAAATLGGMGEGGRSCAGVVRGLNAAKLLTFKSGVSRNRIAYEMLYLSHRYDTAEFVLRI